MSGRSFLCDLWFSQTLRHKNYIYIYKFTSHVSTSDLPIPEARDIRARNHIYIYIYIYIYMWCICQNLCSVKRKFQCPISQLTKTIFTWNFEGDLIDHQPCFIPNFKFLAVQEPNFLEPKFGQNRLLTGFCMYIGPASVFVHFVDFHFGVM